MKAVAIRFEFYGTRVLVFTVSLLLLPFLLFGINVGGHITQSTIWGPELNPYILTNFLYVDSGVTLRILPGVVVQTRDASAQYGNSGFVWTSHEPIAKVILVMGTLIAEGTEDEPIVFDHVTDNPYYRWGGICVTNLATTASIFNYCEVRYTHSCSTRPSSITYGGLTIENGMVNVQHCSFYNNEYALSSIDLTAEAIVYNCSFNNTMSTINSSGFPSLGVGVYFGAWSAPEGTRYKATIARCLFTGYLQGCGDPGPIDYYYIHCRFIDLLSTLPTSYRPSGYLTTNVYGCYFKNSDFNCGGDAYSADHTAFCRRNTVIYDRTDDWTDAALIGISGKGHLYLSDNVGISNVQFNCIDLDSTTALSFYNNRLYSTVGGEACLYLSADIGYPNPDNSLYPDCNVYNNIFSYEPHANLPGVILDDGYIPSGIYNNTTNDLRLGISGGNHCQISNNVFHGVIEHGERYYNRFSHNCMNAPIVPNNIDEGGNIPDNPLFADSLNFDFHLSADSPCIDAGTNIPAYVFEPTGLPPFDADYHVRTVGAATDMGAYEYGSVYIGGIRAYVYDSVTGNPVDCAKLEIAGKLPEFSDSLGWQSYPTGEGSYTLRASRWDYQDTVIPNVQVNLGEETNLNIALVRLTVENEDDTLPNPQIDTISLSCFPNPFSSSTKLSFVLPEKGEATLSVYNTKGQRVKTLSSGIQDKGYHAIQWNGRDERGKIVSSGLYLVRVKAGSMDAMAKLMVVR